MAQLKGYFRASRFSSILGGLLINFVAFSFASKYDIRYNLSFVTILTIGLATMWQNDYDDRLRDACYKSKTFARDNEKSMLMLTRIVWAISFSLSLAMLLLDYSIGIAYFVIMFLCRFYGRAQQLPFVAMLLVAAIDVSPFAVLYLYEGAVVKESLSVMLILFLLFATRETMKDIEDFATDRKSRFKKTIPVICGIQSAKTFMSSCMIVMFTLPVIMQYNTLYSAFFCFSLALAALAIEKYLNDNLHLITTNYVKSREQLVMRKVPQLMLNVAFLFLMAHFIFG